MSKNHDSVDTAKIQAQIEVMDALLAQGRAAMARVDAFYEEHEIPQGVGAASLLSDVVPERHRIIFSKLITELANIDRRLDEFDQNNPKPSPVAVSARAIGNRYRI